METKRHYPAHVPHRRLVLVASYLPGRIRRLLDHHTSSHRKQRGWGFWTEVSYQAWARKCSRECKQLAGADEEGWQ